MTRKRPGEPWPAHKLPGRDLLTEAEAKHVLTAYGILVARAPRSLGRASGVEHFNLVEP